MEAARIAAAEAGATGYGQTKIALVEYMMREFSALTDEGAAGCQLPPDRTGGDSFRIKLSQGVAGVPHLRPAHRAFRSACLCCFQGGHRAFLQAAPVRAFRRLPAADLSQGVSCRAQ